MRRAIVLTAAAVLVFCGTALAQKGKPKPPASYPGTAEFRCDLGEACSDGLQGDGSGYLGTGSPEAGTGAHLRTSNSELWIGGGQGGHSLTIDFQGQTGACVPSCRWDWTNFQSYTATIFEIQSNVVNGPAGSEVTGGLRSIPIGGSGYARFNLAFRGPDDVGYLLRFNSLDHPDSTAATVERLDACTWKFSDNGALASFKSGVRKGLVHEGVFSLPFEMTFSAPNCQ